ncbi:hypothetical protein Tco_0204806, partial [Tanacetum coccineum]
ASVFILPTRILLDIEQIMRGFLWCQGKLGGGKAKVAWNVVCLPMDEGGLDIRRLDDFNKALMTTQVWKLLVRKESLWVEWIHVYKLRGRSFWDIPYRGNMTWGWRNVLKLRPIIREFIWKKLGNGLTTRVWFDSWCIQSPLADLISFRDIFREGFNKETKVCDLVINGVLDCPTSWLSKYPSLNAIVSPVLVPNSHDLLEWRNEDGLVCSFSAHTVWNTIRARGTKLVIRRRLKTQDTLRHWDNMIYALVTCSLCGTQPDSHDHLFFECPFSQQVWNQVKGVAGLASSNASIYDIIDDIIPFAARKTSKSVIAKLVVAATSYFIWQERNGRLFKNMKRTVNQVVECIMNTVRLKLMSCRLKKSRSACDIVKAWKLVVSVWVSLLREMGKMVASINYDPEGLHSHDDFWGRASAESTHPQPVQAKAGEVSQQQQGAQPKATNSFAYVLQSKSIKKVVKITELRNDERVEGAAVAIPFDVVEEVSARFTNTLYGYFIGKRLAFKLVENYVKNTWAKYGLKRVQLHDDFFLFQFETKDGMDNVLENGP